MSVINSTTSFTVIMENTAFTIDRPPGTNPRKDGLPGFEVDIVPGQQTVPQSVLGEAYFTSFVTAGKVTIISP
jgi:hypothetical protein